MSLVEELKADQDPRSGRCKVCNLLRKLSKQEQAEWSAAFDDRAFTTSSLARAIMRRDKTVGVAAVDNHRKRGHVL